jgi:MFS family permease
LPVALAAITLSGLAAGPINPLLATVTLEIVPSALRGRVLGTIRAGAWASIPAGILLGGVAAGTFGVAATFLAMGLSLLAVTVYGFFNPAFREMDSPRD